jgi:hypothetical protein
MFGRRRRSAQRPEAGSPACDVCGRRPREADPVLACPGCGAGSDYVAAAVAYRALGEGRQSRACTACEQVTIVVEPDMVCPSCERLRPDVQDRLRERFQRLGPGDPTDAPCVGCGYYVTASPSPSFDLALDLVVNCSGCGVEIAVPEQDIPQGQGLRLGCGACGARIVIPPEVWCSKCGLHLRRTGIPELIAEASRR